MTEAGGLLETVQEALGDAIIDTHSHRGDATVLLEADRLLESMEKLRDGDGLKFNFLMDLTAVDYLGREPRFEVVYHLAAIDVEPRGTEPSPLERRLRVKVGVPEETPEIDSICALYAAANWMEREVFDMYGLIFRNHPNLKRVLLYEEFKGHPLRKDYPKERRQPLIGPQN